MSTENHAGAGMSRRRLLRRAAIGAGVAWTAPVLISAQVAAAGTPGPSTSTTSTTEPFACGPASRCGEPLLPCTPGGVAPPCFCAPTAEGGAACVGLGATCPPDFRCPAGQGCEPFGIFCRCASSADCPSGSVCVALQPCIEDRICFPLADRASELCSSNGSDQSVVQHPLLRALTGTSESR
jgi:hypothetical protein